MASLHTEEKGIRCRKMRRGRLEVLSSCPGGGNEMFVVVRGKREECGSHFQGTVVITTSGSLWLSAPVLRDLYMFASSLLIQSLLGSCLIPILPRHPDGYTNRPTMRSYCYRVEGFWSQEMNFPHPLALDISISPSPKVNLC